MTSQGGFLPVTKMRGKIKRENDTVSVRRTARAAVQGNNSRLFVHLPADSRLLFDAGFPYMSAVVTFPLLSLSYVAPVQQLFFSDALPKLQRKVHSKRYESNGNSDEGGRHTLEARGEGKHREERKKEGRREGFSFLLSISCSQSPLALLLILSLLPLTPLSPSLSLSLSLSLSPFSFSSIEAAKPDLARQPHP
jgi:hypothetical protein